MLAKIVSTGEFHSLAQSEQITVVKGNEHIKLFLHTVHDLS